MNQNLTCFPTLGSSRRVDSFRVFLQLAFRTLRDALKYDFSPSFLPSLPTQSTTLRFIIFFLKNLPCSKIWISTYNHTNMKWTTTHDRWILWWLTTSLIAALAVSSKTLMVVIGERQTPIRVRCREGGCTCKNLGFIGLILYFETE